VPKMSIPIPWKVIGNSRSVGWGVSKPNFLKEGMKLNWNLQRGGGSTKKPSVGEVRVVWIFSGTAHYIFN